MDKVKTYNSDKPKKKNERNKKKNKRKNVIKTNVKKNKKNRRVKTRRFTISSNTKLVGKILKGTSLVVFATIWLYAVYHIVFIYQSNF